MADTAQPAAPTELQLLQKEATEIATRISSEKNQDTQETLARQYVERLGHLKSRIEALQKPPA